MHNISQSDLIENLNFDNLLKGCSSLNDIYLTLELSGLNTTKWLPIELNKENYSDKEAIKKSICDLLNNVKNNIRKNIEYLDLTLSLFLEVISKAGNDITRYGIYNNEYFFQLLKNLKAKFSNRSYQCDIEFILVFFSNFRKYYQKLVVNFTEYIVAKYIHNISFNKVFSLKVNLLTSNHLLRERIYARNQKFRYIN
ncbi:hypothetical protein A9299_05170 [Moraxella osloensis]|uniref:Uncharacterized protein n=1 Tax=Faucicola osloensis TaxID=34062 RepID=A0AA91J9L2_FAUOS|nr:hypothetical protein [Moraxella osloensis]OBX62569.1 hypothetical protein A9299_05170 [Moraxella osloensis]